MEDCFDGGEPDYDFGNDWMWDGPGDGGDLEWEHWKRV